MPRREELQDEQWALIELLLPKVAPPSDGRGRPRCDDCEVINCILWILRSGARWKDLPNRLPSYQTCHRRCQRWVDDGTLSTILRSLAEDLRRHGQIETEECFIASTFASAKKRVVVSGILSVASVRSSWRW